jgi:hypothetical protein
VRLVLVVNTLRGHPGYGRIVFLSPRILNGRDSRVFTSVLLWGFRSDYACMPHDLRPCDDSLERLREPCDTSAYTNPYPGSH